MSLVSFYSSPSSLLYSPPEGSACVKSTRSGFCPDVLTSQNKFWPVAKRPNQHPCVDVVVDDVILLMRDDCLVNVRRRKEDVLLLLLLLLLLF
jgi:hypothetical protein